MISVFIYGFHKVDLIETRYSEYETGFSVIIPFRNEEKNLPNLLMSISNLNYSKNFFECLFVNDESSDKSIEIINKWMKTSEVKVQVLNNVRKTASPKKDAIQTAIQKAKYNWIITTDADCILPENWLNQFGGFAETNDCKMVAGPVALNTVNTSYLQEFQKLDFLSLQGSSIGGFGIDKPFMCNGANLAYKKNTFVELNGFEGNDNIASGDDIFILEKFIEQYPKEVHFLKSKEAIVTTFALNSWREVIQQRIRWASKSGNYKLVFPKLIGLIVFTANLTLIMALISLIFYPSSWYFVLLMWIAKAGVDMILINQGNKFFETKFNGVFNTIAACGFYPFFSVYIVLRSLISSYQWKDRKFLK